MKLTLNRSELSDALAIIGGVTSGRTPKQVLQCVLIEANSDHVLLAATDLEIGVRCTISQVQVDQPGSVLVPADKLSPVVRESNDEILKLEVADNICHIRGADSHFQIFSKDINEFPPVPKFEGDPDFELGVEVLRHLAEWTVFSAARENTRYAINGVLWDKKGESLSLVATDGRRLSKGSCLLEGALGDQSAIVPTKAMQVFTRVLSDPGAKVGIKITGNQIMLRSAHASVSSILLEGHFPKYDDVIPRDCNHRVWFDTQELLSAVRRASLLTNEESKGVRMAFSKDTLQLTSRAPEQGEAVVATAIDYDGPAVEIGFNPAFLVDALRVVSEDKVLFEFAEANRPGVLRSGEQFLYVVMPVNLG